MIKNSIFLSFSILSGLNRTDTQNQELKLGMMNRVKFELIHCQLVTETLE